MRLTYLIKFALAVLIALLGTVFTMMLSQLLSVQGDLVSIVRVETDLRYAQAQGISPRAWIPLVMKNYPPPHATKSRYMQSTDWSTLNTMGCNEGLNTRDYQDVVVVLDFGQPWFEGGDYGTIIFGSYQFRSTDQISFSVEGYLYGFYSCAPVDARLTLAVGTSNYGPWVTREHGMAWAQMVNNINAWINSPPNYESKVTARGASDIEPGFKDPTSSRAWVDGYASAYSGVSVYYNYGSCDSCPFTACPTCIPNNGWSVDDIWYVSYGALPAYPLPEIYLTNGINADQWYRMSLYAYTDHGARMDVKGALTQWQACQTSGPCPGTDNKPEQGWGQLLDALNTDSRTAQFVQWSTDISW